MSTVTTTLNKSLDAAVAEMPLFRRAAWKSRLSFSGFRRRVLEDLREKLHDDERASGSMMVVDSDNVARTLQDVLAQDSFTADTEFAIDIDKLRELLTLILEFLPLILKLFTGFASVVVFVALTLLPSVADAQLFRRARVQSYSSCPSGQCPTQSSYASRRAHWTYPGDIASHMAGTHRQNIAGLTAEQLRDNHDALHEGRPVPHRAVMAIARPVKQTAPRPVAKTIPPPKKVVASVPIEARSFLPIEAHYQGS